MQTVARTPYTIVDTGDRENFRFLAPSHVISDQPMSARKVKKSGAVRFGSKSADINGQLKTKMMTFVPVRPGVAESSDIASMFNSLDKMKLDDEQPQTLPEPTHSTRMQCRIL
jgi:hypothetical protein